MDYFLLQPNFDLLNKYFSFPSTVEEMKLTYRDGYPIVVDWFYGEALKDIDNQLRSIIKTAVGEEHVDNLMFILLNAVNSIDQSVQAAEESNHYHAPLKELAQFILFLERSRGKEGIVFEAKSTLVKDTVTLKNDRVLKFIEDSFFNSMIEGQYKVADLAFLQSAFYNESEIDGKYKLEHSKLTSFAEMEIWDIPQLHRRLVAELCIFQLRPYLNEETVLRKKGDKNFSDKQLKFFYEVLSLLKLFEKVDELSLNADYDAIGKIRTALKNYIKWNLKKRSKREEKSQIGTPN